MSLEKQIFEEFGFNIFFAGEVEFYIEPKLEPKSEQENTFLALLYKNVITEIGEFDKIDYESADSMYEISFNPKSSSEAIYDLNKFKDILFKTAETFGFKAIYQPKPYDKKPGCGMHIHLGIFDQSGQSKLARISEYQESQYMLNVVGGLCSTILKNFTIFAPNEDSYKRFDATINEDQQPSGNQLASHNNAPVNVSWGGNNRTTAIRIPTSTIDENTRHIEHRVAGVDADPEKVIEAILEGVYIGLKEELQPPEKIYGNAFDEQYNFLEPFPKTLAEAKQLKAKYNN